MGTDRKPWRVAIVGSGPSGFYAADALLKSEPCFQVNVFERLPVPYGLVRYGVAPDHAKIRNVIKVYDRIAEHERFRFWGNVEIGRDLDIEQLRTHHDAIVFAFGSQTDRSLGIEGEQLNRSYTATEFCAWYNGHPDYADRAFDLQRETAVVIGQGNVAMDVARILSMPADALRQTDMAGYAVEALAESKVKTVHVIGRRGPAQAAFTPKEIGELGEIEGCEFVFDNPEDLQLNPASEAELELPDRAAAKRNMQILYELAARPSKGHARQIRMHFFKSPRRILGQEAVEAVELELNRLEGEVGAQKAVGTGQTQTLETDLFFRSVGYRGVPIPGIVFDEKRGVIPNEAGRVEPGVYAVGWIKRGPSGLIGTNKKDSEQTVDTLLTDLRHLKPAAVRDDAAIESLLREKNVRWVSHEQWKRIDEAEIARGAKLGKPRDNFTTVEQMLDAAEGISKVS
ncbi:MAG: FAD-dependent oxidoreductase [Phycisphaeraceae bacterium]|nr:FAD-dependent oxidoreductase [Phycisphaeraceae bacterium]